MMSRSAPVQSAGTIVLSQQQSLWSKLEKTASNITNANTVGFKGFISQTHEIKYKQPGNQGSISYADMRSVINFSQGALEDTQNQFDIAISGDGFFAFSSANRGVVYSRDGQLRLNNDGTLVNMIGDPILSENGSTITIPTNTKSVSISTDGTISTEKGAISKVQLVDFASKEPLSFIGEGYYKTEAQGTPISKPNIIQGAKEASNVNAIEEVVNLIEISRQHEDAQKVIEDNAKRQSRAINLSATSSV